MKEKYEKEILNETENYT